MIIINPKEELSAEQIFSSLMQRKPMVKRFRLPYTDKQVYTMLYAACRAEVESRYRVFKGTKTFKTHLWNISKWLTGDSPTFGLFLCGGVGNGKTTVLKALQRLLNLLRADEFVHNQSYDFPQKGLILITAKELVSLAKAHNNRTPDNRDDAGKFKRIRNIEILAIDDLGVEPRESMHYGDFVTAAMDVIRYRYENQLCTLITSNLAADDIAKYYDERIADRFREMMHIINFGTEESFRKLL